MNDAKIIEALGGTFAVARLCKISGPSVSEWKRTGIPPARRQFLELLRPELFPAGSAGEVTGYTVPVQRPAEQSAQSPAGV